MTAQPPRAGWTSPQSIEAVRPLVRETLLAVPSFGKLEPAEQRALAANMVKVLSYISHPNGIDPATGGAAPPAARPEPALARAQAELPQSPGAVSKDFKAGAVREGVDQFGALVKKVDFPKFVGGLIKNVFQAIVESSMEQMRAYGELIANVSKTVDSFMTDNITAGAGRDWLAQKYPDALGVEVNQSAGAFDAGDPAPAPTTALATKGENPQARLGEISRDLNLSPPVSDISDPNAELRLVTAARLQMAKSRQQLLASMVMLGINRIVITDGAITAKVIFDMRAEDKAKRKFTASAFEEDTIRAKESMSASYGGWFTPVDASMTAESEQSHVATVASAVDESSESKAEVKAKLSGEVRVNFKSDYLPLEKMATPEMMSVIQGNSTPYNPNTPKEAVKT